MLIRKERPVITKVKTMIKNPWGSWLLSLVSAGPMALWLTVFFVVPVAIVIIISFLQKGLYGGVEYSFSINAYQRIFEPNIQRIIWQTLLLAGSVTAISLFLALPTAYFIARSSWKNFFLSIIIIPFWINFLIRVYAFIAIFGNNGYVNQWLAPLVRPLFGDDYVIPFLYNQTAVILITVYTLLPYSILPLYAVMEKFDFSYLEAARDLGAGKIESYYRVFLPAIVPGIATAILFTFIPAVGSYVVPQLVGGKDGLLLGNVIARELTIARNWPQAAALANILFILTGLFLLIHHFFRPRVED